MVGKIAGRDAMGNKESVTGVAGMVSAVKKIGLEMDVMELLEEKKVINAHNVNQVQLLCNSLVHKQPF
jgi:hypothetical protein